MKKFRYTTCLLFVSLLVGCGDISSPSSVHTHTYSDKILYDDTHHWYEVTCGHDDAVNKITYTIYRTETVCVFPFESNSSLFIFYGSKIYIY